jgi:hypothetical protein
MAPVVRLNGGTIDQMAKPFPNSEAAWAYLILIGCAADRQTVTYDALTHRIKRGGPNILTKPLGMITRWCQHHNLPALASLVVEQATGLPAPGFAAVSREEIPHEHERVCAFDWYGIFPPTLEELAEN